MQFLVNRAEMKADRVNADAQFRGRSFVLMSVHQQLHELQFLRGKAGISRGRRRLRFAEEFDHPLGYLRGHDGPAFGDFFERFQQADWRCLLQEISAGTGADGLENPVIVLKNGEQHRCDRRVSFAQDSHALEAAQSRQADVDERNAWQWPSAESSKGILH